MKEHISFLNIKIMLNNDRTTYNKINKFAVLSNPPPPPPPNKGNPKLVFQMWI
jgi:hypothetical protein